MHSVTLVFALFIALSLAHECQHGKRTWPIQFLESTNTRASSFTMLRSKQTTYDSIRIYPDYSNLVNATAAQKDWVMNQLMPNAISYFQSTLKINRLTSNVKAEFTCYGLNAPADLQNTGVVADLIILVGTENDGPNGARAISGTCGLSKVDNRPSFGALIFNLDLMDLTSVPLQEQFLVTAMHEMTHILGFSKPVYPYFIDPATGNRLTNHIRYKIVNNQNITLMDTPPLTSRLRTYFNCSSIEGAYLEQEGGVGNAGAHFETRIFSNDMMVGASRIDQVISIFDLAMLEGTGWYQPNYTNAEAFTWGQGDGCGFYNGPCVSAGGVPLYDEYCAPLTQKGCTNNARGKAFCGAFPGYVLTDSTLPTYLDYWSNKTVVGYKFADNCPVYGYYANSDCEDPTSKAGGITGEVFTSSSRCFPGTLVKSSVIPAQRGYCFNVTCQMLSTGAFNLTLTLSTGAKVNCAKAGPITVAGYNGTLTCPEPNYFCANNDPNYCERGCLGRGVCTAGKCVCPDGWQGSDCGVRTYVSGCARCASDPLNKICYGNMCVSTTS